MSKRWVMGGAVLLLASFSLAQKSTPDEDAIRKLDVEWSAAAQSHDLEKTLSYYTDDASVLPSGSPLVATKAGVRAVWAPLVAPGASVKWEPTKIEVAKSRDMAYTMGTYELKMQDAQGKPTTEIGKYVEIWKKQADGQWKVVVDIFNPDK